MYKNDLGQLYFLPGVLVAADGYLQRNIKHFCMNCASEKK